MKKLILLVVLLFTLTGCAKNSPASKVENNINPPATSVTATPTEVIPDPDSSEVSEVGAETTESPQGPVLNKEITEALTTYMYESFSGSGDEKYAADWYKYIDYYEVYQEENTYSGVLHLKERPLDASARLILSQYYSDDQLDVLCPTLLDVGAALNLEDVDLCLIGENLYKISTSNDSSIYYYSLAAMNIPIYDFLSSGFGESVDTIKSAIRKNLISGDEASKCLFDYMSSTYKGKFEGLSMENVKVMAMTSIANFKDVRIETITVVDQDNKKISKYQKLN